MPAVKSSMCRHEPRCLLPALEADLKTGDEQFCETGNPIGATLLDFWRWSGSNVLSNAWRGSLAEYLVGHALGAVDSPPEDWASYDLETSDGIRVEVKSAAYVQTWCQKKLSQISFSIGRKWDEDWTQRRRHAHVYVFALLAERDKEKINPLDIGQWEFYVVPTSRLDEVCEDQKTLRLNPLRELAGEKVPYAMLEARVRAMAPERA